MKSEIRLAVGLAALMSMRWRFLQRERSGKVIGANLINMATPDSAHLAGKLADLSCFSERRRFHNGATSKFPSLTPEE